MIRPQASGDQAEFWIARSALPRPQASKFYDKLEETLAGMDFSSSVRGLCAPLYSPGEKGRPPIDPVVYFKSLFENSVNPWPNAY